MKKPDQRFMQDRRRPNNSRRIAVGAVTTIVATLILTSCTSYLPIGQGASVPWANALVTRADQPIDDDRYRVQKGDALSSIASRHNVRLTTLAAANNIQPPYILYPGEVLRIPADAPLPAKRPEIIQTALSAPTSALEPAAKPAVPPTKPVIQRQVSPAPESIERPAIEGKRYVVAKGESIALIAVRHKLTLGELVSANNIDPPYRIKPGQVLIIPGQDSQSRWQGEPQQSPSTETAAASTSSKAPPLSAEGFVWPVYGDLIGTFEERGAVGRSGGINIAARKGTPVRASENGIVAYAGEALSGYGHLVMVRHDKGYVTLYAHNDVILVNEGDLVRRGQTIAEVGQSGDVSESQLHFEIRKGKAPIDPTEVLAGLPGRQVGGLQ